jgi:hypothetical protein
MAASWTVAHPDATLPNAHEPRTDGPAYIR